MENNLEPKKDTNKDKFRKMMIYFGFHFCLMTVISVISAFFIMKPGPQNLFILVTFYLFAIPIYLLSIPINYLLSIKSNRLNFLICGFSIVLLYQLLIHFSTDEMFKNPFDTEFPLAINIFVGSLLSSIILQSFPNRF